MTSETTQNRQSNSTNWRRFSLRTTLLLIVVVAGLFAAYQRGYEQGRRLGPVVPSKLSTTRIYSREYDVTDIIASSAEAEMVIDALHDTVEPDSWDVVGGYAEASFDPTTGRMVVSQVWLGHVGTLEFLSEIRDFAADYPNLQTAVDQVRAES